MAALTFGTPLVSATADPEPTLKELSEQVEKLHEQIGTLSRAVQRRAGQARPGQAGRHAAQKTLTTSESDLESKRYKASMLAQNAYMMGGLGSALPFNAAADPDAYLDRAATGYAIEQQQGEQVAQVTRAMKAAERAKSSAKSRAEEV